MGMTARRVFPLGFLLRVATLLALYTLTRTIFFISNRSAFESFSTWDLVGAFALGFRFDAWVVAAGMLPLFFLEVWSWKSRSPFAIRMTSLFSAFILSLHAVFLFCEFSDSQYFKFTGRRTTLAILKLSTDTFEQSFQLLRHFWIVPVLSVTSILLLAAIWRWTRTLGTAEDAQVPRKQLIWSVIAGIVIGVFGLRGGLQTKPIATAHAMLLGDSQLAALALSTSFQMTHSAENREVKVVNFFSDEKKTREILEVPRTPHAPVILKNYNVVVLVVESLSSEYFGYRGINATYAPFLKKLSEKSLFFDNAYANGRTSMEAFPSILASVPSMLGDPFITSQYSSVNTLSLGHELAKRGYDNQFFHGCNNGSMYIDSMAKLFGFPKFFGRSEYPRDKNDFDGSWGIYDEPFLQFAVDNINKINSPFAVGIFTLSSHNPYKIPTHLKDKLPNGKQPFHKSLAYADYAVQKFFESAEKQPWYKNTLFVITGDHTSDLESKQFLTEQGHYRVPLMFFDPSGQLKPALSHRIVQHTDVFPTVLDLLGIDASQFEKPMLPFGQSVFIPERFARAANRSGGWFWYQEGSTVVRILVDQPESSQPIADNTAHAALDAHLNLLDLQQDTLTPGPTRVPTADESEGLVKRAKAYLQFFNNRMSRNTLLAP